MKVRVATAVDAVGIARVHIDTWRTTYRGIVPDSYLDNLQYEARERYWAGALSDPENGSLVYVAEAEDGQVVGFASGEPAQSSVPGYEGELHAIYVLQEHQGRGLGKALLLAVARRLQEISKHSMLLWALADNESSRRFYEALGGQELKTQQFELGGVMLDEVAYGWPDTRPLLTVAPGKK